MDVNAKVRGTYLGVDFSGTVTERRPLYVPTDGAWAHFVKLDNPIEMFGEVRDTIVMTTLYNGRSSSYTKHTCWMQAA